MTHYFPDGCVVPEENDHCCCWESDYRCNPPDDPCCRHDPVNHDPDDDTVTGQQHRLMNNLTAAFTVTAKKILSEENVDARQALIGAWQRLDALLDMLEQAQMHGGRD